MNVTPLTNASPVIQFHIALALGGVVLTPVIHGLRNGSPLHCILG